jgi:hypothetical protein
MTIPRHFTSEPRRSIHRLDCHLVGADQILGVARKGEVLRFQYENGCQHASLSDGRSVAANAAFALVNASVVPVGGALFANMPG